MVNNNLRSNFWTKGLAKAVLFLLIILGCSPVYAQVKKNTKRETDTFKIANQFIAKKKFRKADKILKKYHAAHPKDMNSVWLQAQTKLYLNNYSQSNNLYQSAIKMQPDNDYLKLDYIHSSADMGKMEQAENRLAAMENSGKDYSAMTLLRARLYYYQGNFKQASAYMKKALQQDNKNIEANLLNDEIELARAAKVSLNAAILADDQPLTAFIPSVKAEKYFNKSLNLYIEGDDYHFMQNTTSDAPWIKIGDRLFFPKAGLHVNIGGGVMKFPVKNTTGYTGEFSINEKISQHFDIDLGVDHVPYFGTKASVDTTISVTRFSAMLNYHVRNWQAQVAYLNSNYPDNNNVSAVYGWVLAPIAVFPTGKFQAGYSISYNNSNENRFRPANSLNDILKNPNSGIAGVYDPYFTPNKLVTNTALFALSLNPSAKVSINLNGEIGYASASNPYFYINKTYDNTIKDYSTVYFVPYSASASLNYQIEKTWVLNAKYMYRSTYFFNSNYVSIGLQKSFLHNKKTEKAPKSAFMKSIKNIEQEIQSLYSCKNKEALKQSVAKIKSQLIALRDAQQKTKSTTEVTPGSEKALVLQDRYNSLNEMISEIDDVNLDEKETTGNKKEWLVDKQYELTSIYYNGSYDEE